MPVLLALACACATTSVTALTDVPESTALPVPSIERTVPATDPFAGNVAPAVAPAVARVSSADVRALLGWAVHLSDYPVGLEPPEVRVEPEAFFVANACLGRSECRVLGWYADQGVVHLHERVADMDSLFARSLLVHELVHYLQHASARFTEHTCESFVAREREAYAVQQAFFVAHGAVPGIRPHHFGCVEDGDTSLAMSR